MSTFRRQAMADCRVIDYGFVMEAEYSFRDLCLGVEFPNITGLLYRMGDEVVETRGDVIERLDDLKFPRYERFELSRYLVKRMRIVTSRGCPHRCIYCPVESAIGKRFRARSPQSVVDELCYWYERGYRDFEIADDNFSMLAGRVDAIYQLIEERRLDISVHCANGLRADSVDEHLLSRMRGAGFKTVAFGVEAGNNRMLRVLKKSETIEVIENAIRLSCKLGFDVILFFLVGSPSETWADVEESIALARKYPIYDARFYNIIPFPNTVLFEWVRQHGYFLREPEEYLNDASLFENDPCFRTPELDLAQRRRALSLTAKVSKEIKRSALTRRLKRYGIAGRWVAYLFLADWFRALYLGNRRIRSVGERLKWLFRG
jgi:anaerobic magnesium-protoporphyrin IX monomethyl ester cyclase